MNFCSCSIKWVWRTPSPGTLAVCAWCCTPKLDSVEDGICQSGRAHSCGMLMRTARNRDVLGDITS